MRKPRPVALITTGLSLLALAFGMFFFVAEADAQTAGDAAAGQVKFSQTCTGCHLQNGTAAGRAPVLAGKAREAAFIRNQVRNGGTRMPAFGPDKVSDTDLDNLVAYVQSLATATPAAANAAATTAAATTAAANAAATTAAATTAAAVPVAAPATGHGQIAVDEKPFNPALVFLALALIGLAASGLLIIRQRNPHS